MLTGLLPLRCTHLCVRLNGKTKRSVDLAVAALPEGGAQLELLELARRRTGERVAELDRRRALEVRHLRAAVLDQVGLGRARAWCKHDERLHRLAPFLVRHA